MKYNSSRTKRAILTFRLSVHFDNDWTITHFLISQKIVITIFSLRSDVSTVLIITGDLNLRATQDFDPEKMTYNERTELENILKNQGRAEFMSDSNEKYNLESQVNPYAEAIPFKRGDKMKNIPPAFIG